MKFISVFDFFFIDLLVVKFLVTCTGDSSLAHFGIVMDMGVGETAAAHKEYLNAQQHNCQPHNSQCQ